jgi:hypothetical protein
MRREGKEGVDRGWVVKPFGNSVGLRPPNNLMIVGVSQSNFIYTSMRPRSWSLKKLIHTYTYTSAEGDL